MTDGILKTKKTESVFVLTVLYYCIIKIKRAFNQDFENLRKNLKKYVYQHDPIAILATHPVKKV